MNEIKYVGRKSLVRKKRTVMHNYSHEQLVELGMPTPVVQGLQSMTDLNVIMKKIGPAQLAQMAAEQQKFTDRFGIQQNLTARDAFMKAKGEQVEFSKLPAEIREYYNNNSFDFIDDLQRNKDNKYYLQEVLAKVVNNPEYQKKLQHQKQLDEIKKNEQAFEEKSALDKIANAVKSVLPNK